VVRRVQAVHLAQVARLELLVHQVLAVHQELVDLQVRVGLVERRAQAVLQELQVLAVHQALAEVQAQVELLVRAVRQELAVRPVLVVHQVHQVLVVTNIKQHQQLYLH
jgi:hypothetical protein